MKTSFAIGCLVQWYESDLIHEYFETLQDSINLYDGDIIVDILVCSNQSLEECIDAETLDTCIQTIELSAKKYNFNINVTNKLVTIADYRRNFNETFCTKADVLVWGESDMLVPKQMFVSLNYLHQNIETPKYLATFGICKMWDDSWKPLEHVDFTDKPFIEGDTKNWWSIPYTMTKDEMNSFNDVVDEMQVTLISPHKFNGCGLVISSEVIKSGVNIPNSVFFIHEDTAFMLMTNKVLGNIPQYHFKNILIVHNRKHPNKRKFIKGEEIFDESELDKKRKLHDWYVKANKMCSDNCYNLFNPMYKSYTWNDVKE